MASTQTISRAGGHEQYELQNFSSVRQIPPSVHSPSDSSLRQFWRRQVSFPIPQKAMRDHLGK